MARPAVNELGWRAANLQRSHNVPARERAVLACSLVAREAPPANLVSFSASRSLLIPPARLTRFEADSHSG